MQFITGITKGGFSGACKTSSTGMKSFVASRESELQLLTHPIDTQLVTEQYYVSVCVQVGFGEAIVRSFTVCRVQRDELTEAL